MEPTSSPAYKGAMPWHVLLLTASLLIFWSPPTTAQITVESVPPNAAEGKEVLLLVHKLPEKFSRLDWFRGEILDANNILSLRPNPENITKGPAYSNREMLYPNGSLLIRNLAISDTKTYSIQVITEQTTFHGKGELHVYALLLKPSIKYSYNGSVSLTCDPYSPGTAYQWYNNTQPIQPTDRLQLSSSNSILTIFPLKRNDRGPYVCETSNPVSVNRSSPFIINITYGPDPPEISLTQRYYSQGVSLNLSCLTDSNPPAKYSWFMGKKPLGSTQNLSIPKLSLSDSGSYSCIVSNSATNYSNTVTIHITVLEEESTTGMPVWTFLGILIGLLFGVKLTAVVGYFLLLKFRRNQGQHDSRQLQPTSGSLGPGAPSSSSSQST